MECNDGVAQGRNEAFRTSRRSFLGTGLAGGVASLIAGLAAEEAFAPRASAQTPLTPDEALKELMDGNARFVEGRLTSFEHDLQILKSHTVDKQEPFAALLSCADSRVPVELIFDQSIGHLFVTRVAGNMATPEIIGSLEYGAAVLGTKVILVLGHASCGAVKATMQGKAVPGQISSLFPHIQPAVDKAGHDLEMAIAENARIQATLLREASPVLAEMVREDHLKIVAGTYDLGTGRVTLLEG
ncbi:carbonic anhydrase [Silvibacterium dinghuense]|uniref:carbonic anhydrase n=1 Tax=Silvibacterium dinghuense TaxID=1560006 RepID=A0A4Q1SEG3_9BACT|nr:carbonic anhydrase [Silvibacterium dinghuense]RXS95471.1 carbonic anhydrase [Silvibacterium dinghuense]GGH13407.1 carbonic anhydrase [Silvibacterium dinghuense]